MGLTKSVHLLFSNVILLSKCIEGGKESHVIDLFKRTYIRSCSIITSRIGGGWVLKFFMILHVRKQGGEWYFTIKKIIKTYYVLL